LADDATVSRQHCLLEAEGAVVKVCDLGSKNGTFVNGVLVGQREASRDGDSTLVDSGSYLLHNGDQLVVGQNVFEVDILQTASAEIPRQGTGTLLNGMLSLV